MSTYTVTEDRGWHSLWRNGRLVLSGASSHQAADRMRLEKIRDAAEAMLALLVDSKSIGMTTVDEWCDRRDALIRQINGESK